LPTAVRRHSGGSGEAPEPLCRYGRPGAGPIRLLPPQLVEMTHERWRSAIHSLGCASGLLATSRTKPSRDGTIATRSPRCSASASRSPSSSTRRSCGWCSCRPRWCCSATRTGGCRAGSIASFRECSSRSPSRRWRRSSTPSLATERCHRDLRLGSPSHAAHAQEKNASIASSPAVAPYEQTRAGRRRYPSRSSASPVAWSSGSRVRRRRAVPGVWAAYRAGSRTLPPKLHRILVGLGLLRRVRRRSERSSRR
jgi:hypothetical protein